MTEERLATVREVSKAQWIRVLDVVLIGPLMIGGGLAWRRQSLVLGLALAAFGVATVYYNGKNYLANRA
jgi:1,4-dihydroxy-2-naphthoate octaprenyltransferase